MDPEQALENMRTAAGNLADDDTLPEDVTLLVESVQALDEWLSKGGFLPADWSKGR